MSSRESSSDEEAPPAPTPAAHHQPSHSRQPPANGAAGSSSAAPAPEPAPATKTRHSSSSSGDAEPAPAPRRSKRLRRSSSAGAEHADEAGGEEAAPTPVVRRRLFGPVEPGSVERARIEHEAAVRHAQTQRWNFDFQAERPLPGRYKWTPVPPASPGRRPDSPGAGPAEQP